MKQYLSAQNRRDAIALIKMMLPIFGLTGVGIYFNDFVGHAVAANKAINLGIIFAASYGVVLILNRLVSAILDFRVIERFGHEAHQGVYMKTLLEQPWLKRRYVRHYLGHIADTGGTLSTSFAQNAIENELHALQAEYDSKLELPQFLVGFMIAMGLLGTFIGLLETLTGISGMLDGMGSGGDVQGQFMKLVVELRKPLAGMGIAFSASMFGLITSLLLAIMMTNLRRYISRVIALARNVMHELTEMKIGGGGKDSTQQLSPEEIARMALDKQDQGGGMGGTNGAPITLLAGRFDVLAKKLEMLLGTLESSVAATQKTNDLLSFGPRMKDASEKTVEELRTISMKHGEQQALLQKLVEVTTDSVRGVNTLLDVQRQTKELSGETLEVVKVAASTGTTHTDVSRQVLDAVKAAAITSGTQVGEHLLVARQTSDDLRALLLAQAEQRKLVQAIVDAGVANQSTITDLLAGQRQARGEFATLLENLANRMGKGEEIGIGSARHLFEIKENFTKMCKSLEIVELIASGVSGQSLLLELLVQETRTSQKTLEAMQHDIHGQVTQN